MLYRLKPALIFVLGLLTVASCQRQEKREDRAIDHLLDDTQGSFPETVEKTKQFEKEVKEANAVIKQEAKERVDKLNRELKEKSK